MKGSKISISNNIVRLSFIFLVLGFVFVIITGVTKLYLAFFIAFLVSFLMNPAVNFIESFGLPRILGILLLVFLVSGIGYMFFQFVVPSIQNQFAHLLSESEIAKTETRLQEMVILGREYAAGFLPEDMSNQIQYKFLKDKVISIAQTLFPSDFTVIGDLLTFILIAPVITIILLLQGDSISKRLMSMVPNQYFEMVIILSDRIKSQIRLYLKGLSLQWLIFTSVFSVSLWIAGIPFALPLGLFAATFNIIPYFGPVIGMLPSVFVVLLNPELNFSSVLLAIITTQLVDNTFTQPVVLAGSVKLHPLIAILTLITLQQYLGIIGMVIAIPLASIVMSSIEIIYKQMKAFGVI